MAREKNFKDDYWISKEKRLQTWIELRKRLAKIRGFRSLAYVINSVKFIDGIDEENFERQRNAAKSYSHSPHLTITQSIGLAYSRTTPYKLK